MTNTEKQEIDKQRAEFDRLGVLKRKHYKAARAECKMKAYYKKHNDLFDAYHKEWKAAGALWSKLVSPHTPIIPKPEGMLDFNKLLAPVAEKMRK